MPATGSQREQESAVLLQKLEKLKEKAAQQVSEAGALSETIESEIAELRESIEVFLAACKTDVSALGEQQEVLLTELAKAHAQLEQFKSPPFGLVTFVRFIRNEKKKNPMTGEEYEIPLIEMKDGGGNVGWAYFLDEDTDVQSLQYGQHLLVQGGGVSHVLETLGEYSTEGACSSIVEILSPDHAGTRFLVATREHDTPQVMHAISSVDESLIEKGTRILADTAKRLVLEVLPQEETSDAYLVGEIPDVTFENIGGLGKVKERIEDLLIDPILFPGMYRKQGESSPKGGVLTGPPGVGKTMTAKAILNRFHHLRRAQLEALGEDVSETDKPLFFHVKGAELHTKWLGESQRKLRELFAEARRRASPTMPVGIFFDEVEALLPIRGSGVSSDIEKTMVTAFNAEMDGIEEIQDVIVILATNRADLMDGAVIRRLNCVIDVPRPDREGAKAIFEKYLKPEWGHIHPRYCLDVHTPLDKHGKPRVDSSGKTERYQFRCDPVRACGYLIDKAVEHVFDDASRNEVVKLTYENGREQVVRFCDLISGARIANIVSRAKRLARRRFKNSLREHKLLERADEFIDMPYEELQAQGLEALGVQKIDLHMAIEEEFSEIHAPGSFRSIHHWLTIEGLTQGLDVVSNVSITPRDTPVGD